MPQHISLGKYWLLAYLNLGIYSSRFNNSVSACVLMSITFTQQAIDRNQSILILRDLLRPSSESMRFGPSVHGDI